MSKLSITELKKQLNKKTKAELVQEIANLTKKFKPVKEFYAAQQNPANMEEVLQSYKTIIEKEFIEGMTRGFPKLRFSVARKALNDFKKINNHPRYMVDLMFCYAGAVSSFASEFGPNEEKFYTTSEDLYENALQLAQQFNLTAHFQDKAFEIMENACEGWGHKDSISDSYARFYGEDN